MPNNCILSEETAEDRRIGAGVHFTWGEGQDTGPRDTWNLHAGHVAN